MSETISLNNAAPEAGFVPKFSISLRPFGDSTFQPNKLEVTATASMIEAEAGKPAFRIPIECATMKSCDIAASSIEATDDGGQLNIQATDDPVDNSGYLYYRRYSFHRATKGNVTLKYTVGVQEGPKRRGPPFNLLAQDGGISGAGVSFLVVPDSERKDWETTTFWDLDAMPPGSTGFTSCGSNPTPFVGDPLYAQFMIYMAGPLTVIPSNAPHGAKLNGAWLGAPSFDTEAVTTWCAKLYPVMVSKLPNNKGRDFQLMGRRGFIPTSGGVAATNSFLIGYGNMPEPSANIKFLLAHELAHPLAGSLEVDDGMRNQWYSEGLAEFYKLITPIESGLASDEEVLAEFRKSTRGYYASRLINMHNDDVRALFWADRQAQKIPYARGLLYFLALNHRMLAASNGERSLDDLVNIMQENEREGRPNDLAAWKGLLFEELGEAELQILDDMIEGKTVVPPIEIFGTRFVRRELEVNVIDPGFPEKALSEGRVYDLDPDSRAFAAGLRNGDFIESHDYEFMEIAYSNRPVTLRVTRGNGLPQDITFEPYRGKVTGYEWDLNTGGNVAHS
ncbi:hypothetical protein [Burkholderia pyrrocinia]|uniref:hypothetical protein n=1 Tax=Burkholderia pyrrocinia TaxID=60550 RepID=UPI002AAF605D|nr:hypothetical protein [Burkholderia pyrrocinia]